MGYDVIRFTNPLINFLKLLWNKKKAYEKQDKKGETCLKLGRKRIYHQVN